MVKLFVDVPATFQILKPAPATKKSQAIATSAKMIIAMQFFTLKMDA